jgi:outer membrane protein
MPPMQRSWRVLGMLVGAVLPATSARGEDLADAWRISLGINQQLQAEQTDSFAEGENLAAARAARVPRIHTFTFDTFIAESPRYTGTLPGSFGGTGSATGTGGAAGLPVAAGAGAGGTPFAFPILGKNQHNLPFSYTSVDVPLFTFGRISGGVEAARGRQNAQRANEFRTALDLKLTVAEAYIAVLRARRNLDVARSNVAQLASFARDVTNQVEQGVATENDQLAAEVALDNAKLREIRATNALDNAWATYNRYLCRPLMMVVPLEEVGPEPSAEPPGGWDWRGNPSEVQALMAQALRIRPELAGLSEQARSAEGQSRVAQSGSRPQVLFTGGLVFAGSDTLSPQANYAATFLVDWTLFDAGASRRRSNAYRLQESALLKRRNDLAADIALQVRTQWNNLRESRFRVRVARHAVTQSEENIRVVRDRYQQGVSTYTEVLDAETRRLESLTNFYDAYYDVALAGFRLRRAVGNL